MKPTFAQLTWAIKKANDKVTRSGKKYEDDMYVLTCLINDLKRAYPEQYDQMLAEEERETRLIAEKNAQYEAKQAALAANPPSVETQTQDGK